MQTSTTSLDSAKSFNSKGSTSPDIRNSKGSGRKNAGLHAPILSIKTEDQVMISAQTQRTLDEIGDELQTLEQVFPQFSHLIEKRSATEV